MGVQDTAQFGIIFSAEIGAQFNLTVRAEMTDDDDEDAIADELEKTCVNFDGWLWELASHFIEVMGRKYMVILFDEIAEGEPFRYFIPLHVQDYVHFHRNRISYHYDPAVITDFLFEHQPLMLAGGKFTSLAYQC